MWGSRELRPEEIDEEHIVRGQFDSSDNVELQLKRFKEVLVAEF